MPQKKMSNQDITDRIKDVGILPFLMEGEIDSIEDEELARLAKVAKDALLELSTRLGKDTDREYRDPLLDSVNMASVKGDTPGLVDRFLAEQRSQPKEEAAEDETTDSRPSPESPTVEGRVIE